MYFEKVFLINVSSTSNDLLNHYILGEFLLTETYGQGAVRKEICIAPFFKCFKTNAIGEPHW